MGHVNYELEEWCEMYLELRDAVMILSADAGSRDEAVLIKAFESIVGLACLAGVGADGVRALGALRDLEGDA